jgi:hypothetical protein
MLPSCVRYMFMICSLCVPVKRGVERALSELGH